MSGSGAAGPEPGTHLDDGFAYLDDAFAAGRRYSRRLLTDLFGGVDPLGALDHDPVACAASAGAVPAVQHIDTLLFDTPAPSVGELESLLPRSPAELLRALQSGDVVVVDRIEERSRFTRRLAEHLEREGARAVLATSVVLGGGTEYRHQSIGRTAVLTVTGAGTVGTERGSVALENGIYALVDSRSLTVTGGSEAFAVWLVTYALPDHERGLAESATPPGPTPPVRSSATLDLLLNALELRRRGLLNADQVIVRCHRTPEQLDITDNLTQLPPDVIGRLLSVAPVSARELAEIGGLDPEPTIDGVLQLAIEGVVELCAPGEALL